MIPVVFITDENFVMQTGVAIWTLLRNKATTTEYDIFVVMAECSDNARRELEKSVEGNDSNLHIIETSLDMYRDIKQLAHIPIACCLKFNICDLIPQYDKLVYLDGDICVRGDLTELYETELGDNVLAGVPSLDMLFEDRKLINAGILLFNAKAMRDEKLAPQLMEVRKSLGDRGSMDQQTFNMVLGDRIGNISFKYNCTPNKFLGIQKNNYTVEMLNGLYGTEYDSKEALTADATIIHYDTGGKPWKYDYIICGDEWYEAYKASPYNDKPLKRETKAQTHWRGFWRNLKEKGIKGVISRVDYYIKALLGKNDHTNWG